MQLEKVTVWSYAVPCVDSLVAREGDAVLGAVGKIGYSRYSLMSDSPISG